MRIEKIDFNKVIVLDAVGDLLKPERLIINKVLLKEGFKIWIQ